MMRGWVGVVIVGALVGLLRNLHEALSNNNGVEGSKGPMPTRPQSKECYHGFYTEGCPNCEAWLAEGNRVIIKREDAE